MHIDERLPRGRLRETRADRARQPHGAALRRDRRRLRGHAPRAARAGLPGGADDRRPQRDRPGAAGRAAAGRTGAAQGRAPPARGRAARAGQGAARADRGAGTARAAGRCRRARGQGPRARRRVRARAASGWPSELGVRERVVFAGYRDDVPALLAGCDVFVLPSHAEGLPLTVLEAMAAAKPVVATAVGGTPEVVADGETGLLVPPGDVDGAGAGARPAARRARARAPAGRGRATASRGTVLRGGGERARARHVHRVTRLVPLHRDPGAVPDPALQRARRAARPARLVPARTPSRGGTTACTATRCASAARAAGVAARRAASRWVAAQPRRPRARCRGADVVLVGGWNQPAFWQALAVDRVRRVPRSPGSRARSATSGRASGPAPSGCFARNTAAFVVPGTRGRRVRAVARARRRGRRRAERGRHRALRRRATGERGAAARRSSGSTGRRPLRRPPLAARRASTSWSRRRGGSRPTSCVAGAGPEEASLRAAAPRERPLRRATSTGTRCRAGTRPPTCSACPRAPTPGA